VKLAAAGALFMHETAPFSLVLPILQNSLMILFKQSCSLINDLQLLLKDQHQEITSFEYFLFQNLAHYN
jgi:hypothetical protein